MRESSVCDGVTRIGGSRACAGERVRGRACACAACWCRARGVVRSGLGRVREACSDEIVSSEVGEE